MPLGGEPVARTILWLLKGTLERGACYLYHPRDAKIQWRCGGIVLEILGDSVVETRGGDMA